MGGPKKPKAPETKTPFQASGYKIGDQLKSSTTQQNGVTTTQSFVTPQEEQAYKYLQGQLPSLYQKATTPRDFTAETNAYTQNQTDALNRQLEDETRTLKAGLVNSGQVGSSIAVDKLRPLSETYLKSAQEISAGAPLYAQQLAQNEQALNLQPLTAAQEGINKYYGTGTGFNTSGQVTQAIGQNIANQNTQNAMAKYQQEAEMYKADQALKAAQYKAAAEAATLAFASDLKTKKNIKYVETKKGIKFYEFEYKTDEYPELPNGKQYGVIAQEIENIIPDAVIQGEKYKLVDYSKVVEYLEAK
jgi:hypothetical protein